MFESDKSYFTKHALVADPEFDWDEGYFGDYDYDDPDPMISMDDDIVTGFDDEPLDDDSFYEAE